MTTQVRDTPYRYVEAPPRGYSRAAVAARRNQDPQLHRRERAARVIQGRQRTPPIAWSLQCLFVCVVISVTAHGAAHIGVAFGAARALPCVSHSRTVCCVGGNLVRARFDDYRDCQAAAVRIQVRKRWLPMICRHPLPVRYTVYMYDVSYREGWVYSQWPTAAGRKPPW